MAEARPTKAEELACEPSDVDVRAVLWTVLTLVAAVSLVAAALGGLVGLFDREAERPPVSALARVELAPPQPRLDAHPAATLAEVKKRETAALEGYGWVDRDAGIARIPIERAMRLLAKRGWTSKAEPDREPGTGAQPAPTGSRP